MKSIITSLFICTVLVLLQTNVSATIRRVNFTQTSSPVSGIDFADFQSAHDACANGDTIQIYPSTSGFNSTGTISKKLVIMSSGYFYNTYNTYADIPNAGLQIVPGGNTNNANYSGWGLEYTLTGGSTGTVFQGINDLQITTATITDSINNITISRCQNVAVNFNNSGVCNNWLITQCWAPAVNQGGFDAAFTGNRTITNLRIENSYNPGIAYSASGRQSPVGVNSGQILNCIIDNNYSTLNNSVFVVQNCIDLIGSLGGCNNNNYNGTNNTIFINNITTCSSTNNRLANNPGSSGNIFNANFASNSVFLGYPTNLAGNGTTILYGTDSKFQLATNSIAKGAGLIPGTTTATDCGIFGGTNPYKASGIPPVPAFYKLNSTSSQATTNPYIITFSVRGNN